MIRKNITRLSIFVLALAGMGSSALFASELDDRNSAEHAGFFVRGLKICHQGEWRNMTVFLEYESEIDGNAMDIQNVRNHVRWFLEGYPNTTDFWEVMNTNLVHSLVKKFPDINVLKSTLSLAPDKTLIFPRESIVQYDISSENIKESFNFTKLNYLICTETFKSLDLHVAFDLKDNPTPADYPDYQWVDQAMEEFFEVHPIKLSGWSIVKPQLEEFLLERFPTLTAVEVQITVAS